MTDQTIETRISNIVKEIGVMQVKVHDLERGLAQVRSMLLYDVPNAEDVKLWETRKDSPEAVLLVEDKDTPTGYQCGKCGAPWYNDDNDTAYGYDGPCDKCGAYNVVRKGSKR